jgi:hypothetical protein
VEPRNADAPLRLAPSTFVILGATLACIGLVPAAFWLADESLLPWAEELRWDQLRSTENAPEPGDGSVELWRTGCFDSCPSYSVKVDASGRVDFYGMAYTCESGARSAEISPAIARELISDIAEAGFFDLSWNQGNYIADASDSTIELRHGGQRRSLPNIGMDSNAPRLLRKISGAIDSVAGTQRWLPFREMEAGGAGRERFCRLPDGSRIPAPDS